MTQMPEDCPDTTSCVRWNRACKDCRLTTSTFIRWAHTHILASKAGSPELSMCNNIGLWIVYLNVIFNYNYVTIKKSAFLKLMRHLDNLFILSGAHSVLLIYKMVKMQAQLQSPKFYYLTHWWPFIISSSPRNWEGRLKLSHYGNCCQLCVGIKER